MLMMMHMGSLILLLSFLSFRQMAFSQLQLHPNEVDVVREIAATLGAKLTNPSEDPCQSGILSVTQTYKTESLIDNIITCNYTDGIFSHVTHIKLKGMSLQGKLPPELVNLTFLEEIRISDNSFNGSVPEFIGRWTKLKRLEMQSSGLEGPINATIFTLETLNDLRITDMSGPKFDFPKRISKDMNVLVLRNLNMSGSIPIDIWDMVDLETL